MPVKKKPGQEKAPAKARDPEPFDTNEAFCEFTALPEELDIPGFDGWGEQECFEEVVESDSAEDPPGTPSSSSCFSEFEDENDWDTGPVMRGVGIGSRRRERKAASKMLWSGPRVVPEDDSHIF